MKKRILSLALAICMLLSTAPVSYAGILSAHEEDFSMPVEHFAEGGILSSGDWTAETEPTPEPEVSQGILSSGEEEPFFEQLSQGILSSGEEEESPDEPDWVPEDQSGPGLLVVTCGECGYLDNNHAKDCPVIAPPKPVTPVIRLEECKPAIAYSNTYLDTYAQLLSAETLEVFENTMDELTHEQQDELLALLSEDEQAALDELEDALTRQAIANEPQTATVKKIISTEERTSAFGAAQRAALKQLGYELIVNLHGRIVEFVDMLASSYTVLETVSPAEDADYQWQILADDDWVDIQNETDPQVRVSYAMVASLLDRHDTVELRCEIDNDGDVTYTDPVEVCVEYDSDDVIIDAHKTNEQDGIAAEEPDQEETDEISAAEDEPLQLFAMSAVADEMDDAFMLLAEEGDSAPSNTKHTVIINYVFENGAIAATPSISEYIAGNKVSGKIPNPPIQGYLPYIGDKQVDFVEFNYDSIHADHTFTVTYKPTIVNYTVIHYKQNVFDDNYTRWGEPVIKEALTGSIIAAETTTYDGFYMLPYEKPTVAADGSTTIEIYYDRYYYLMSFDLGGGYGTEPVYARYEASISVDAPLKSGYTFDGWEYNGHDADIPATMPAENQEYTALWAPQVGESSFTVVYWLQNPDPDKDADGNVIKDSNDMPVYGYSYWASYIEENYTAGQKVNGENYKTIPLEQANQLDPYEKQYSFYSYADGETTVSGDNSTVVNVYYNRNTYTLKFYYAFSSNSGTSEKYYVVGGSSNYFGTLATQSARNDEIKLLDQYNGGNTDATKQRGNVDELPTLNSVGRQRSYTFAADTSLVNNTNYQYHYLSFTAKYGADLSNLWPCNVFNSVTRTSSNTHGNWNNQEAFVSAWNGEYNVYYTQKNGNQTIKGNYNELDYRLLWENGDSDTVAYLCFWENGADIGWSVPELYRYHIYVPALEGQDTTNLSPRTWNGTTYVLYKAPYDTVDDSNPSSQTAPANRGLEYIGWDSEALQNFDKTLYCEAYNMYFYYRRESFSLQFRNAKMNNDETVLFGASLVDYQDYVPEAPSTFEKGSVVFDGWYTSPEFAEGTEFTFTDDSTMPATPLRLYAKWVSKIHKAEFYLTERAITNGTQPLNTVYVSHGKSVADACTDAELMELSSVKNSDFTFIGWFHKDENGNEKAFDLKNIPVHQELKLYAKWSSNVLMDYVIYYKVKSDNQSVTDPQTIAVADEFDGLALAGATKTFNAKGGADLYPGYQECYFPLVRSHSITIELNPQSNEWYIIDSVTGEKEQGYTFWYVQKDAVPYTVRYVDKDSNTDLAKSVTVENNRKAVVTETFQMIPGYVPDAYQKTLVVSGEDGATNEIIFYYTQDNTTAYYKITHYTQNTDGETYSEHYSEQARARVDTVITGQPISVDGFTYNPNANGAFASGKLEQTGLELKFYYDRNKYNYKVLYLEKNSGVELSKKVVEDVLYGKVIAESPIEIQNYAPVDPSAKELLVRIDSEDPTLNVIIFYYEREPAYLTINKYWTGATCYGQDTIFTIKGGELPNMGLQFVIPYDNDGENSVTITGLKAGSTYVITEDGGWSWRFTADSQKTITLNARENALHFTNALNNAKIYWFDDSNHKKNKFGIPTND